MCLLALLHWQLLKLWAFKKEKYWWADCLWGISHSFFCTSSACPLWLLWFTVSYLLVLLWVLTVQVNNKPDQLMYTLSVKLCVCVFKLLVDFHSVAREIPVVSSMFCFHKWSHCFSAYLLTAVSWPLIILYVFSADKAMILILTISKKKKWLGYKILSQSSLS